MTQATGRSFVIALVVMTALSACGESSGSKMEDTITLEEASRRVDKYLEQAQQVLPTEAEFQRSYREKAGPCSASSGDGTEGRKLTTTEYQVLGLNRANIPEYFSKLRSWWEQHDYRVLQNEPKNEYLWVEHNPDGFRLALEANAEGELYLGATSPCVWPNGTPEPQE